MTYAASPQARHGSGLNSLKHDGQRAWIARSWARCVAYGRVAAEPFTFDVVSSDAAEQRHELRRFAHDDLECLARYVSPLGYFALLTDQSGVVIDTMGCLDRRNRWTKALARIGVTLTERVAGTNAVSGAIIEQEPVWLHRNEHFFRDADRYSCAAAPMFDPHGACVGTIAVAGIELPAHPELRFIAAQITQSIETAMVQARPHRLRLYLQWATADEGRPADSCPSLICLDGDGLVVGATSAARRIVPLLNTAARAPVHARDLFATPWPVLYDLAREDTARVVRLRSGLGIAVRAERTDAPAASACAQPTLSAQELAYIRQAMHRAGGRVSVAAQALGVSRSTVYRRLAHHSRIK